MKFPGCARQKAIGKSVAFAPPEIPGAAQKGVGRLFCERGQFLRQQTADPEQPRLNFKRRTCAALPSAILFPPDFASARHCVCSQSRGTGFPKAPAPSRHFLRGRASRPPCFRNGLFAAARSNSASCGSDKVAQRRGTFAAQIFRQQRTFCFQATNPILPAARRALAFSDKTSGAFSVAGIFWLRPRGRAASHFGNFCFYHGRARASRWRAGQFLRRRKPAFRRRSAGRAAKIRAALDAGESGMKNADGFALGGLELFALQPLMLPDGLQQALRRRGIFVAQNVAGRQRWAASRHRNYRAGRNNSRSFLREPWVKVKQCRTGR